eukprot:GILI01006565.1.p1 GENE.GILI01006565.1~~GILI01006565.1.p1  ORF type:complete len:359 (-),score=81.44 GILI01006565.1:68-1027(-)
MFRSNPVDQVAAMVNSNEESVFKQYNITNDVLGHGQYAIVYRAIHLKTQKEFAVKVIDKWRLSPAEMRILLDEVEIQKSLKHENVVQVYEYFNEKDRLYIIMELMRGSDLVDRLNSLPSFEGKQKLEEARAARIIASIAEALLYCHSHGVAHRNVSPENILFAEPSMDSKVVLADFGFAVRMSASRMMRSFLGTPSYIAPEMAHTSTRETIGYGKEIDLWGLGVIAYMLLTGAQPFIVTSLDEICRILLADQYHFPPDQWGPLSSNAKDLILQLLNKSPSARLTAEGVLNHPFVTTLCPNFRKKRNARMCAGIVDCSVM